VALLAARLTDPVFEESAVRRLVRPAVGLSAWLVAVVVAARFTGSFVIGLWGGTVVTAGLGFVLQLSSKQSRDEPPDRPAPEDWQRMVFSGLVLALPVAFLAIQGDFFDEFHRTGHRSLVAQFQNDVFPPRHQVFPEYPFRYHYGFNVIAAALTGMLRLSVPAAIDTLVIVGFLWSWCLAWRLGQRLTGGGSGAWAALGGLFGGGAFYWFLWFAEWGQHPALGPVIGGNRVNFPVVMYFFQKPFALGFPLAMAVLLAVSYRPRDRARKMARDLSVALLLGALSIVQTVLFVTVGACVATHGLLAERKPKAVLAPAAALLVAVAMGGVLFSRLPAESTELIRWRFWPTANEPLDILAWYALTSGLLIPLGLVGLGIITRLRALLLLLVFGSFATPLFFTNTFAPWDMLKFAAVGQFAAGLVGGCALAALAREGKGRRIAAFALLVPLLVSSFGHLAAWAKELVRPTPELGEILEAESTAPLPSEEWGALIGWLRSRPGGYEVVHVDNVVRRRQLWLAGLSISGPAEPIDREFGIPGQRIEARRRLLSETADDLRLWNAEGISLFVLLPRDVQPAEPNDRLIAEPHSPPYARWVASGELREVKRFGYLALYEIVTSKLDR
jgi:hypothetical protein